MVIRPKWVSTMPATSGTRKAPAGMRSRRATSGPMTASASVSASGSQATGGNQTMALGAWAGLTPNSRATSAATAATSTTRRYCISATRRASAPYSSDMRVMTEAAPALLPHRPVVPGSNCRRVITTPSRLEAATTRTTPAVNSTQWRRTSSTIDSGTILAIRQPTMPWASTKGGSGKRTLPPLADSRMPASSGPSSRAAGA